MAAYAARAVVALRAGALRTNTAPSTSAPPASCTGLSDSPKARKASTTVVTGSAVERIEAVVGPTRVEPGEEQADGTDGRDDRDGRQPAEARRGQVARVQVARGGGGDRQRRRGAGADERAEQQRADARGDAGRGEDVGRVDDGGRDPQQRPHRIERPGARPGQHEDEAGRREHERAGLAPARPFAPERDRGDRDHRGEGVEQQRQQRRVEALRARRSSAPAWAL